MSANGPASSSAERNLIDELLAEQSRLTPVERFARQHDRRQPSETGTFYRERIPASPLRTGEQYAFSVDMDACTGCKACVSACHSLNGLEENEMWRSVGVLHGVVDEKPYQQTVTTACHHCVEPGCLEGCPVGAYEKDEDTGIVRHLDDQCIGCQYCILKCPYDVPKYSERLGIVRKCDMCIGRLQEGEAPACVQACPTGAIRIGVVEKAEIVKNATEGTRLVAGAFDSSYTKPTTRYISTRPKLDDDSEAGSPFSGTREPAHWPLICMLVLSQLSVGILLATPTGDVSSEQAAWLALHLGLGASVFHLGRPLGAWRFFLGLRTSWMSREILAFSLFSGALTTRVALQWLPPGALVPSPEILPLELVIGLGLLAVFTSAMIYIDTRRPGWRASITLSRFFGSVLICAAGSHAGYHVLWGVLAGVFWERYHFFTRVKAPRMPPLVSP